MLRPLIVQLRAMQVYAQSAHNLVARVPFFADHEAFNDFYGAHSSDYDSVVERHIGLYGDADLHLGKLMSDVALKVQPCPSVGVKENSTFFQYQLLLEQELCKLIASLIASGLTEGTKQLLGDICNASEVRQYRLKQRLKR